MKILITGGAGFIGTRLAEVLVSRGAEVIILDSLTAQVHGPGADFPAQLKELENCTCVRGDVCDRDLLGGLLGQVDAVAHLAAETGTGQSMYEILKYQRTNIQGTSTLVDILVNERIKNIQKIVVASSRAVYGEGDYSCHEHGIVNPRGRSMEQMSAGNFELQCPLCGLAVTPVPTREVTPFAPLSFYGLTKQVQEQEILMFGQALAIDAVALRYQNVYGPGQSLNNPYTGLLAVFAGCAFTGAPLLVFEDGQESRDFVYIDDAIEATVACLSPALRGVHAINVGSGVRTSVLEVAQLIKESAGSSAAINITGNFRLGDIRHNVADTSRMRALTGVSANWKFSAGVARFVDWAKMAPGSRNELEGSIEELKQRGMFGEIRSC